MNFTFYAYKKVTYIVHFKLRIKYDAVFYIPIKKGCHFLYSYSVKVCTFNILQEEEGHN